ncbi:hypothetical protein FGO68_gene1181 [Halteria grandinella]|uniref:Uncharacterized protein n=1 Tax=Halteria grandinella TaxID=5974 RepID=A0A8J8NRG8_HALGN|nr:hypothetical protein FGO68_gene1181 [Halteria grandinella]
MIPQLSPFFHSNDSLRKGASNLVIMILSSFCLQGSSLSLTKWGSLYLSQSVYMTYRSLYSLSSTQSSFLSSFSQFSLVIVSKLRYLVEAAQWLFHYLQQTFQLR